MLQPPCFQQAADAQCRVTLPHMRLCPSTTACAAAAAACRYTTVPSRDRRAGRSTSGCSSRQASNRLLSSSSSAESAAIELCCVSIRSLMRSSCAGVRGPVGLWVTCRQQTKQHHDLSRGYDWWLMDKVLCQSDVLDPAAIRSGAQWFVSHVQTAQLALR